MDADHYSHVSNMMKLNKKMGNNRQQHPFLRYLKGGDIYDDDVLVALVMVIRRRTSFLRQNATKGKNL
jgi:hypothetical protein